MSTKRVRAKAAEEEAGVVAMAVAGVAVVDAAAAGVAAADAVATTANLARKFARMP